MNVIEAQLARILGFFPRVDAKASGLFAVNSAIMTIGALNIEFGDLRYWYVSIPGAVTIALLVASFIFLYRANFPQLKGGEGSLIYFMEIRKRTEKKFIDEYLAVSEKDYQADLLGQVWRNSEILSQKYEDVAVATKLTLAALCPFLLFLVATAMQNSRVPLVGG